MAHARSLVEGSPLPAVPRHQIGAAAEQRLAHGKVANLIGKMQSSQIEGRHRFTSADIHSRHGARIHVAHGQ